MTAQRKPNTKARRAVDKTARKAVAKLPKQVRRRADRSAEKLREVADKRANGLDARTRRNLYELARRWGIRGRSRRLKQQLIDALRRVRR